MKTEFEFINNLRIKSIAQNPKSKVKVGIGDDCAVIKQNEDTDLVITTDLLVEDIDFRLGWTTPKSLGVKALTVSLSDVAAMGAKPLWALVSIGVPEKIWKTDFVERFYDGWFLLNRKFDFGVELAGGDVSKTPDKIVIDSIVAGEVSKGKAILRSGAKVSDLIYVTGELGGAAAGLKLLEKGVKLQPEETKSWQRNLIERQTKPMPQTTTGGKLGEHSLATAMIDLSDGLSSDLKHLCIESGVGAKIYADKIPIHRRLKKNFEFKDERLSLALNGGEDYELLFTVNPQNLNELEKHISNISMIGEIVEQNQGITLIENGQSTPLLAEGFRHF